MGVGEAAGTQGAIKFSSPEESRQKVLEQFLSYKRHSTSIALMWGIFTCGFVVINVIVFIQPQWIHRYERGTSDMSVPGYIGLYERCELRDKGFNLHCEGKFYNFGTIGHPALRAATFFVGVSCLIIWICIALFCFFFILKPRTVFIICGSLQFISAVFMSLGCLIFPAGWNHPDVAGICGSGSDQYVLADCQVGWAYILAMVGTFDIIFLTMLAFVLAGRQLQLSDTPIHPRSFPTLSRNGVVVSKNRDNSSLNDDADDNDSIRPTVYITPGAGVTSSNIRTVEQDRLSEFSQSTKKSFRSDFAL